MITQQHCQDIEKKKKKKTKQIETLTILINIYYLLIMLKNNLPKPMPQS